MMWLLTGELRRVTARSKAEDGRTHQLQLLCEEHQQNGEIRESLVTLTTGKPERFQKLVGDQIVIEVTPWARKDGSLGVMLPESGVVGPAEALQTLLT